MPTPQLVNGKEIKSRESGRAQGLAYRHRSDFSFFLSSLQRLETQGGSERSPRLRYLDGPGPSSHSPDSPVPLSRSGAHPLTPSLSVTRDSHQSLVGHRPQNFNSNQSQVGLPACVLEGRVVGVWVGGGGGLCVTCTVVCTYTHICMHTHMLTYILKHTL